MENKVSLIDSYGTTPPPNQPTMIDSFKQTVGCWCVKKKCSMYTISNFISTGVRYKHLDLDQIGW